MTDVFVSYAKANDRYGEISAIETQLRKTISLTDNTSFIQVWFDENNIRISEAWDKEIDLALAKTNTVAVFVSPEYFASKVCNQELRKAVQLGKKIIPIWLSTFSVTEIEQAIKDRNAEGKPVASFDVAVKSYEYIKRGQGVRYDKDLSENKQKSFQRILEAIFENATLNDGATKWLDRALTKENSKGTWLTGSDLLAAEKWLSEAKSTKNFVLLPKTENYILDSRKAARKRRSMTMTIGVLVVLIIASIGIFAAFQSNERQRNEDIAQTESALRATQQVVANDQTQLARARQLGQQANLVKPTQYDLSLLLAAEAYKTEPNLENQNVLREIIKFSPYLDGYLRGHQAAITALTTSYNGKVLISGDAAGDIRVWDLSKHALVSTITHQHQTAIVGFVINQSHLISADASGQIVFWDAPSARMEGSIKVETSKLLALTYSQINAEGPSAYIAYAYCADRNCVSVNLEVADIDSRTVLFTKTIKAENYVTAAAFDPTGVLLALGVSGSPMSEDNLTVRVNIYQVVDGQLNKTVNNLAFVPGEVKNIAFAADGQSMVVAGCKTGIWGAASSPDSCTQGEAVRVDLMNNTLVHQAAPYGTYVTMVDELNVDGNYQNTPAYQSMVMGSAGDRKLSLVYNYFDPNSTPISVNLLGHFADPTVLRFDPINRFLISGDKSGTIIVWDLKQNDSFAHPISDVMMSFETNHIAISSDGALMAVQDQNGMSVFDTTTHDKKAYFEGGQQIVFSPNNQYLILQKNDGGLWIAPRNALEQDGLYITNVETNNFDEESTFALSDDSALLAIDTGSGNIRIYHVDTQGDKTPLSDTSFAISTPIQRLNFAPDSRHLAVISCIEKPSYECTREQLALYDATNARVQPKLIAGDKVFGPTVDLDAAAVLTCVSKNAQTEFCDHNQITLKRFDERPSTFPVLDTLHSASFSPDGRFLAGIDDQYNLALFDATSGKMLWRSTEYSVYGYSPTTTIFSRNSHFVASGNIYGDIRLWDVATGLPLLEANEQFLRRDSNPRAYGLYDLQFTDDAMHVLASGAHVFNATYSALLWNLDAFSLACRAANRNISIDEWTHYLGDVTYVETCPNTVDATTTWDNLIPTANNH